MKRNLNSISLGIAVFGALNASAFVSPIENGSTPVPSQQMHLSNRSPAGNGSGKHSESSKTSASAVAVDHENNGLSFEIDPSSEAFVQEDAKNPIQAEREDAFNEEFSRLSRMVEGVHQQNKCIPDLKPARKQRSSYQVLFVRSQGKVKSYFLKGIKLLRDRIAFSSDDSNEPTGLHAMGIDPTDGESGLSPDEILNQEFQRLAAIELDDSSEPIGLHAMGIDPTDGESGLSHDEIFNREFQRLAAIDLDDEKSDSTRSTYARLYLKGKNKLTSYAVSNMKFLGNLKDQYFSVHKQNHSKPNEVESKESNRKSGSTLSQWFVKAKGKTISLVKNGRKQISKVSDFFYTQPESDDTLGVREMFVKANQERAQELENRILQLQRELEDLHHDQY